MGPVRKERRKPSLFDTSHILKNEKLDILKTSPQAQVAQYEAQIVLYFKTLASFPSRQGWIPLKHPAQPASPALLLFSVPQFPLTEPTRELLAAQPWLPWALMVPCPLWAELSTRQLAHEPEAARALLVSAQPRPGFGTGLCPPLCLP